MSPAATVPSSPLFFLWFLFFLGEGSVFFGVSLFFLFFSWCEFVFFFFFFWFSFVCVVSVLRSASVPCQLGLFNLERLDVVVVKR